MSRACLIPVTPDELAQLATLSWQWPAVFSCNARGDVWPSVTRGLTPLHLRAPVQGRSRLLAEITRIVVEVRAGGGRFEVDDNGVRLAVDGATVVRFVT